MPNGQLLKPGTVCAAGLHLEVSGTSDEQRGLREAGQGNIRPRTDRGRYFTRLAFDLTGLRATEQVQLGMPAQITVEGQPHQVFAGHLERISVLPGSAQAWLNPDLKQYNCEVYLNHDAANLRPGMSCRVELVVETQQNALFFRVQALVCVRTVPTVYVFGNRAKSRSVP